MKSLRRVHPGASVWCSLLPASLSAATGCGDSGVQVSVHPVSGKVVMANGKPLDSGTIYFEPVAAPAAKASGKIQPDGSFTLSTRGDGDGAAEGASRVFIVPDGGEATKRGGPVPPQFTDPDSSGLAITIKPGQNRLEPIVLGRKPARASR